MDENLLRFRRDQNYLIFDYETCNLNLSHYRNKPWQLGFITARGSKIMSKEDLYISFKDLNISDEAKKITGFNQKKYDQNKQDPKKCLDMFEKYLYDPSFLIIGHNILGFDVYMHNIHRFLCGKSTDYSYINRVIDTNCIARAIKNNVDIKLENDPLSFQYKLLNLRTKNIKTNLKQLCKDYSINFENDRLHEALYDVEKTFEVFQSMIWKKEI